jgi:cobalt-precorrin 5A hydrolase
MDLGETPMIAGIGCRAGVSCEQVAAAIDAAVAALVALEATARTGATAAARRVALGIPAAPIVTIRHRTLKAIATPAAKAHEQGIQAAATTRGVPVLAISQPSLEAANAATVTRSAHSLAAMNVHSVAEAAALAGAGRTPRLLLPRITVGPVTCALADTTPT